MWGGRAGWGGRPAALSIISVISIRGEGGFHLTQFRRTSDRDLIPGPEQGFDIVGGYFSADLKSFLSHSLNIHFPITWSSMAFLKIKVMLLS